MIRLDETPPAKVMHPYLRLGISPKAVIRLEDKKKFIEYTFDKGKFLIKIVPI